MRRDVFNAIADPTRRGILISLVAEAQNVNALAEKFDMSRQAVSLHVKYLEECGVITIRQMGRERYCELKPRKLSEVVEWLSPFASLMEGRFNRLAKALDLLQKQKKK